MKFLLILTFCMMTPLNAMYKNKPTKKVIKKEQKRSLSKSQNNTPGMGQKAKVKPSKYNNNHGTNITANVKGALMKYLILSMLCIATLHAGKKHRAEKLAAAIAASNAAAAGAKTATTTPSKTSSKCTVNCPGPKYGGCWGCNPLEQKQQSLYDKK